MLWWIVAPDTISAHDVSVKILRRFRAERSCPHHKIKKNTCGAPSCFWVLWPTLFVGGKDGKTQNFRRKFLQIYQLIEFSRSGSRGISSQKHRVETWGNCRRTPRSQKRRPGMCSSCFIPKRNDFFAELIFICLMFLMRFVTYGFAFQFLHVFTFFGCKRTD